MLCNYAAKLEVCFFFVLLFFLNFECNLHIVKNKILSTIILYKYIYTHIHPYGVSIYLEIHPYKHHQKEA